MARGPQPDEFAYRLDIRGLAEKLVGLFVLRRAAEARGDRIDKHQVGDVQNRVIVVQQAKRRLWQCAILVHLHAPRSERPQLQPHGGGTGPAVETKSHGPLRRIGLALPGVGDVKD